MRKKTKDSSFDDRLSYIYDLFPDLKNLKDHRAKTISGGQQQMLAIGRALVNENQLLLIDEPTEGLSPKYAKSDTINQIKEHITILLVEQNFRAATNVGDTFYIMDDGKIAHSGNISELINNNAIITKYLGLKV